MATKRLTKDTALQRWEEVYGQSRSRTCSFINELAWSGLIEERVADSLADILASAKGNEFPVMEEIKGILLRLPEPAQ